MAGYTMGLIPSVMLFALLVGDELVTLTMATGKSVRPCTYRLGMVY